MQRTKAAKKRKTSAPPPATVPDDNRFYKIGEVCAMTDTQPYVLRFWESEFPQLAPRKSRSGQRIYRKSDIDLVQTIKRLLYDQEYTIPGARKKLEEMGYRTAPGGRPAAAPPPGPVPAPAGSKREKSASRSGPGVGSSLHRLRKELLDLKKTLES
jgi:DNA-binding transcriptional MerR regulator